MRSGDVSAAGPEQRSAGGLFGPEFAALTLAIVSLITVIAFESMAVSTAMPEVAVELDAVRS